MSSVVGSSPGIPTLRQLNLEFETWSRQGAVKGRDLRACREVGDLQV